MGRGRLIFASALAVGCGGGVLVAGEDTELPSPAPRDAGAETTAPAATPPDTGAALVDTCAAAVQAGAPLAMVGGCSTRDARARVLGPQAPHVTWTTGSMTWAPVGLGGYLLADASGSVYLLRRSGELTKVNGSNGLVDWSLTSDAGVFPVAATAFLTSSGEIEAVGAPATGAGSNGLDLFEPLTGQVRSTVALAPAAAANQDVSLPPAIGADGSIYLASAPQSSSAGTSQVARVLPGPSVAWTASVSVAAGVTSPQALVALGKDDLVVVASGSSVTALDPATGTMEWSATLPRSVNGYPRVAPDGSIAVTAGSALYVLEPTGGTRHKVDVPDLAYIEAIGANGTIVLLAGDVMAVTGAGQIAWSVPAPAGTFGTTIDSGGTILVTSTSAVVGLDLATGATRWTLTQPAGWDGQICGSTLTSSGTLVVAGGWVDNLSYSSVRLFGASD